MWPQGFLASFLPTASSFFLLLFSLLWVLLSFRQLCSLGISLFFKKSIGISQNRGGGVAFNADYSTPYQLFISLLVDFNPKGTMSLIYLICRHYMVNIQREKCKGCCGEAQQNRNRFPTVSPWRKVSVLLDLCIYFATRELLNKQHL